MADTTDLQKAWTRMVAKAWADDGYKARLLADPAAVFQAEGLSLPAGKTLRVVEAAPNEALFVLPRPLASGGPASEEERISPILY